MRALVCSSLDGYESLAVGELPDPELGPGAARVRVEAAGVNFPDLLITRGLYQEKPPLPFAPGMEMAGTVAEVAAGVVSPAVGDRVFGFVPRGAYAAEIVVPADSLYPIPDGMEFVTAAALPIAFGTSYHALVDRARLAPGETVLVLGAAGGVGLAAVQIAIALGARVLAAVSSDAKAAVVTENGAEPLRYDQTELRHAVRQVAPDGVDVVYDAVGGDFTEAAFRSLRWNGRHLVVGFAAGPIPALPANLALLKGASLVGVFWGRFTAEEPARNQENFARLAAMWSSGSISPHVSGTYPLGEAVEAMRLIEQRQAVGKLVVEPQL